MLTVKKKMYKGFEIIARRSRWSNKWGMIVFDRRNDHGVPYHVLHTSFQYETRKDAYMAGLKFVTQTYPV